VTEKPKLSFLIAGLLFLNTAGFFLRYFEVDTFFILLGFRLHFSIIFFFLLIIKRINFSTVKEMFLHPAKQKYALILVVAFLPLLFVPLDMFLLEEFNFADKDYFFELGLSSIADYPVYLIWNAPQLFLFFVLVNTAIGSQKYKFYKASLITFLLFLYEIIPLNIFNGLSFEEINILAAAEFLLISFLAGFFLSRFNNIYLFTLLLFTLLWGTVLFFGSSSSMVVKIILASQYESWSGLINPGNKFPVTDYLPLFYLFILLIFSSFHLKKRGV
jgi:hypothetical protein